MYLFEVCWAEGVVGGVCCRYSYTLGERMVIC